jgi:hypothetical protein
MQLPASIEITFGSSVWALGICGVAALFILCGTCVILSITSCGKAPEVLRAFADVVRAFRRRPRNRSL